MPLPPDEAIVETSHQLVGTLKCIFGSHPGYRPVHAKGVLLKGTFTPTDAAGNLSSAPHFHRGSTPVIARFSSFGGLPDLPDTDPSGNPRGFALRFILEESPRRVHTDIITHSTPFFPARNGPEILAFFRSLANGTISDHLATHPAAQAFVQAPKPFPASFATEKYFSVNAFKLISKDRKETMIRYRLVPEASESHLDDEEIKARSTSYLFDAVPNLVTQASINFDLLAQVAEEGDVTDDCTVQWPEDRPVVKLGMVKLDSVMEDNANEQKSIIFDPIPRVNGIEPSADPLLDVRAAVYLTSGTERRAA